MTLRLSGNRKLSHAGIVIGVGLGGLVDSFLLHMILQWHHMLSNVIPPDSLENMHRLMSADGMFDAACFLIILIGVLLLRNAATNDLVVPSFVAFAGQMIFGWGLFNTIEGIVDHHLLQIHYVRQVPEFAVYNWTFLGVAGAGFLILGWLLMRRNKNRI
ncbi:MAG TPA: DUF2243 domain-containing protein [Pyrinomonadaceae bacterium]